MDETNGGAREMENTGASKQGRSDEEESVGEIRGERGKKYIYLYMSDCLRVAKSRGRRK